MDSVIYTRVSTQEQANSNNSLHNQEVACRDYAAYRNIDVVRVFEERGESAKTADRTQLKEMMAYVKNSKGGVKNVIIWKLDRLSRKTEDYLMLKGLFKKMGVSLHSVTESFEDNPTGALMENIVASFAEFDNSVKAERSAKGMLSRLKEGGWVHIAPIGYRNTKDSLGRPTIEPDAQSESVAALLNEFSKGTYRQLDTAGRARDVYGIKSRNGNDISNNGVYKMLRNPIYAGYVHGKGLDEPIRGLHRSLISEDTFRMNQAILKGRNPKSIRPPIKYSQDYSLKGHLRCGYCGTGFTGSTSRGRGGKPHSYYHCTKCRERKALRFRQDDLEARYRQALREQTPPPHIMKLFREILFRWWNNEYADSASQKHSIENNIQKLETQKIKANQMRISGAIDSDEELKNTKDKINDEIDTLKIRLVTAVEVYEKRDEAIDMAIDFMADAAKVWDAAKGTQKSCFQQMIYPGGISVYEKMKFGTAPKSVLYEEASLLESETTASKKTQNESESLVVIPRGIEPLLPG